MSEAMAVDTRGLTKRYGSVAAVEGLNLQVPGSICGLLGRNGAGKTTSTTATAEAGPYVRILSPAEAGHDVPAHLRVACLTATSYWRCTKAA